MKIISSLIIFGASAFFLFTAVCRASSVVVEIFYLPHPPAEAVVRDVEASLNGLKGIELRKYNFEAPESRKQIAKYNIREHTPVLIYINGKNEFVVGNRKIVLKNFPKGNSFVPFYEGNWSYQDVRDIMRSIAGVRS